jgi:hypothetical protein
MKSTFADYWDRIAAQNPKFKDAPTRKFRITIQEFQRMLESAYDQGKIDLISECSQNINIPFPDKNFEAVFKKGGTFDQIFDNFMSGTFTAKTTKKTSWWPFGKTK